jgi:hypothetical protein
MTAEPGLIAATLRTRCANSMRLRRFGRHGTRPNCNTSRNAITVSLISPNVVCHRPKQKSEHAAQERPTHNRSANLAFLLNPGCRNSRSPRLESKTENGGGAALGDCKLRDRFLGRDLQYCDCHRCVASGHHQCRPLLALSAA